MRLARSGGIENGTRQLDTNGDSRRTTKGRSKPCCVFRTTLCQRAFICACSAAPGPYYQTTFVRKLKFSMPKDGNCTGEMFFRAPARSSGVSSQHDQVAQSFEVLTVEPMDAILKSSRPDDGAAIVRSWWLISGMEWVTVDPGGYWA